MDWAVATQMKLTAIAVPIENSLRTPSSLSLLRVLSERPCKKFSQTNRSVKNE
jgi:hypothetical protein